MPVLISLVVSKYTFKIHVYHVKIIEALIFKVNVTPCWIIYILTFFWLKKMNF